MDIIRLACQCGWEVTTTPFVMESLSLKCPLCTSHIPGTQLAAVPEERPSHWLPLHQYPVDHAKDWDRVIAKRWYDTWKTEIPSYNCSCTSHWAEYEKKHPPIFDNPKAFFEWSVVAHNYVSKNHANNPAITMDDAWAGWWGIAPRRKRRLVMTVATGKKFNKLLAVTRPALEAYAERCNADFIALTNTTEEWWGFEKFRVKHFAEQYEQTLFIDTDAVPWPDTPDIFDMVPLGSVGIHDDWKELLHYTDWLIGDRKQVYASQNVESDANAPFCYNTGVVVCDPSTADIWTRPTNALPRDHTSEQTWIEYLCQKHRITLLPISMNTQWWMTNYQKHLPSAHIVHFANCPSRPTTIPEHMKVWHEKNNNCLLAEKRKQFAAI